MLKDYLDSKGNRIIEYDDRSSTTIPKAQIPLVQTECTPNLEVEIDDLRARVEKLEKK